MPPAPHRRRRIRRRSMRLVAEFLSATSGWGSWCVRLRRARSFKPNKSKAGSMRSRVDWDDWCSPYLEIRQALLAGRKSERTFAPPPDVVNRLEFPTASDIRWLCDALKHETKKWFVAD